MDKQTIYQTITNPQDVDHRYLSVAFRKFFEAHQYEYSASTSGYAKQTEELQQDDVRLRWTWGRCFPSAQFTFYALGGYAQKRYILKCSRKNKLEIAGNEVITSHWFVYDTVLEVVVDPTSTQFFMLTLSDEDMIGNELRAYETIIANGKRANFGFPYYKVNGRKIDFGCTVPSKEVLRFYQIFRKEYGILPGLEPFYVVATANI